MSSTQASGFDRFNETLRNLDHQLQDLRGRFDTRRKRFESKVRKQADRVQTDLRKSTVYKRAEQARKDIEGTLERTRSTIFEAVGLATKADVEKLNRKLNVVARKLSELTKEQV